MKDLLIHEASALQLKNLFKNPSHAVLITGPEGMGKLTIAEAIAAKLLGIDSPDLDSYSFFIQIKPKDNAEIPIDDVRQLLKKLKLKTTGGKEIRRLVLIENGHRMSPEAQNAILKILEEPSSDTVFIITASTKNRILPTVASRAQHIHLQPVPLEAALRHFHGSFPEKAIERNWRLSRGAVGLLQSLLKDDLEHPMKQAVDLSKKFLSLTRYDRLLFLDGVSSNKEGFKVFLEALSRVIGALHEESIASEAKLKSERLLASRKLIHSLNKALEQNASAKLTALKLVMNLGV